MPPSILGPNGRPLSAPPEINLMDVINQNWQQWADRWSDHILNPDRIGVREYEQMYETDETVFSGMEYLIQSLLSRLGEYTHPDETIQEFIRENLAQIDGSFMAACSDMLTALWAGFSVTEILWRPGKDGKIWLRGLQTLHPSTITFDIHRDGPERNRLRTIWQWYRCMNETEIPPSKAVIYSHDAKFGNIYGKSRLKRCWPNYSMKKLLMKAWGIAMERYGTPYTIAKGQMNNSVRSSSGEVEPYAKYLARQLDGLGSRGSLVVDRDTEVDIVYAAAGISGDFRERIAYDNRSIHQAIGLPALIADAGDVGSYSLGQQHAKQFLLLIEQIFNEFIEVIVDQLIARMIELNFGEQADYGTFAFEDFLIEDLAAAAQMFKTLTDSGFITPERLEDMNYVRERLGLPLYSEEDMLPSLPAMPIDGTTPADSEEETLPDKTEFSFSWAGRRRSRLLAKRRRFQPKNQVELEMFADLRNLLQVG